MRFNPLDDIETYGEIECATCLIPGAPAHEPSRKCHYRPYVVNHCTCSACH